MNKPFLGIVLSALLLSLFFPASITESFDFLGLNHNLTINRESFFYLLLAAFGVSSGIRVIPLVAMVLGCFLTGPMVTIAVASLVIYDRLQLTRSWWFSLKDYFSLLLLVLSCGLPDPLRVPFMFCGVIGVSLDFGIGVFGLMPALLFAHTMSDQALSGDIIFAIIGVAVVFHIIWVSLNGARSAAELWNNTSSMFILSFSLLLHEKYFLPAALMTVLFTELIFKLNFIDQRKKLISIIVIVLIMSGLPFFSAHLAAEALYQKELFWAIPFIPLLYSYFGNAFMQDNSKYKNTGVVYPLWVLLVPTVLGLSVIWWNSAWPLAKFVFDQPTEPVMSLEQNDLLIVMGLISLGLFLGYVLNRFYSPTERIKKIEMGLKQKGTFFHKGLVSLGQNIPEEHLWITSKYNTAKLKVSDYIYHLLAGLVAVSLFVVCFALYKDRGFRLKLDPLKLVFFVSWCISLALSGVRPAKAALYVISLSTLAGGLFLEPLKYKILSWFFSFWIANLIASSEGMRSNGGISQKFFILQIFGVLVSVLGVALSGFDPSLLLVLLGVLIVGPTFLHVLYFSRFFNSISKRAYFFSVATPAMVGIDILASIKPEVTAVHPVLWQTSLLLSGGATMIVSSVFSLIRNQTKSMLIGISQAGLGLALALLASDDPALRLATASIFVFLVSGLMLHLEATRYSKNVSAVVLSVLFGMPVFIGFNVIFYSSKALSHHSPWLIIGFIISLFFQSAAIVNNLSNQKQQNSRVNLKFICLCLLNLICAVAIHLLGIKNVVG